MAALAQAGKPVVVANSESLKVAPLSGLVPLDSHLPPAVPSRMGEGRESGTCGLCATDGSPDRQADVAVLRYLDVCLVLATAPFG